MPTRKSDPVVGSVFFLDVPDIGQGYFSEASGFGSESEVVEHKAVDSKGMPVIQKIPGRVKWDNITLRRGITSDMALWQWRQKVIQGDIQGARKNGSVVLLDREFKEVARFNFVNGWPVSYKGADLKADDNGVVIEEVSIAHEGLERA